MNILAISGCGSQENVAPGSVDTRRLGSIILPHGQGTCNRQTPQGGSEHPQDHQDDADDRDGASSRNRSSAPSPPSLTRERCANWWRNWPPASGMSSIRCFAGRTECGATKRRSRWWSSPAIAALPGRTTAACCGRRTHFIREQEAAGKTIDLYVAGKKGIIVFNFQKRPITQRIEVADRAAVCRCRATGRSFHRAISSRGKSMRCTSRT